MEYSHRLAEKRRRDRMNISISEIAQLLPSSSVSKQLEKAEILEKTISYIKTLQGLTEDVKADCETESFEAKENQNATEPQESQPSATQVDINSKYFNGFSDCVKEVFHCLTNVEAMDIEQPCFQRLMRHLQIELQVLCKQVDLVGSDDNHKDKYSKAVLDLWQCKRTHENSENPSSQDKSSSGEPASKRTHRDSDKNSCSDGRGSRFSLGTVSSSYALHPSGTHFIPVVLHVSIPLPPFPDTNGRLNPVPNGYLGAFNQMRMGYPHFPYFPGFPFSPQLCGSLTGMTGGQNPKDESRQKQHQSKPQDSDPSNMNHEHLSVNACTNQELSNTVE